MAEGRRDGSGARGDEALRCARVGAAIEAVLAGRISAREAVLLIEAAWREWRGDGSGSDA